MLGETARCTAEGPGGTPHRSCSELESLPQRDAPLSLLNGFAESIPSYPLRPLALAAPRPVYAERLPANFFLTHEPPKPAVQTLVAIVAHHEVGIIGHGHRPEIVTWIDRPVNDPRIDSLGE